MKILALDTSTDACSVALLMDGHVTEEFIIAPQQQAQLLLPMIESVLSKAGVTLEHIDAFAFGRGPGSFTGLRIAASVTQALAFAKNRPVIPVSTLQAMAHAAMKNKQDDDNAAFLVCLDARMHEVYCAAFIPDKNRSLRVLMDETVCKPADIQLPAGEYRWQGVGNGWASYAEPLQKLPMESITSDIYPRASDIVMLAAEAYQRGESVAAEEAVPVYLRNDVAWQNG